MYRQFARISLAPIIGPIPEEARHPERIGRFLAALGQSSGYQHQQQAISDLAAEVHTLDEGNAREPARWKVGDAQVTCRNGMSPSAEVSLYHLLCRRCVHTTCPHTRALFFAFAWLDPEWRDLFQTPVWEMMMAHTMTETANLRRAHKEAAAAAPTTPPHEGHARYHVLTDNPVTEEGIRFRMKLIRRSKQSGEPLKPMTCPDHWEEVVARVSGLTEVDEELFGLIDEIRVFDEARRAIPRMPNQGMRRVRLRMVRQVIELLARCLDVRLDEDEPITVDPTPLRPRLEMQPEGERWRLTISPGLKALWRLEPAHVLTTDNVLRPVPEEDVPLLDLARWGRLPTVPTRDLMRFLGQMAASGIPVTMPEDADVEKLPPPEARLYLQEADGDLILTARMAYLSAEQVVMVELDDRSEVTLVDSDVGPLVVRRDLAFEQARRDEVGDLLNRGHYGLYRGEQALDVLVDVLPRLADTWAVFGQEDLKGYALAGRATPQISFKSGEDWFDLDVTFHAGSQKVPRRQVIESWRTGKKYIRLKNGTIAWLQREWLDRFGPATLELDELRRAGDGKVGDFAAMLLDPWFGGRGGAEDIFATMAAQQARAVERLERIAGALSRFEGIPDRAVPASIAAEPRSYQRSGFAWLAFLRGMGLNGCLADDMGLGKTLQALMAIVDTIAEQPEGERRPSLVVAPTSVLWNWEQEAHRFAPTLDVRVHHGTRRATDAQAFEGADLVVTSYPLLRLDEELLGAVPWLYVVLDEAQQIKNPLSQTAKAARAMKGRHRLALTGTPVENNLIELWSLFEFLMPGFFGSLPAFRKRYANPVQRDLCQATLGALRRRIKPFVLRRLKREVATELPARQEVVLYCELDPRERVLYERVRDTYRETVREEIEKYGLQGASIHVLEALTRLRQACCHPALLPFDEAGGLTRSAKVELLLEVLETTIAEGHRTLVFSQWPSLFAQIRPALEARGWAHLQLDGTTTGRAEMVDAFNADGGPPIFLISLKAGGTGLNLTAADHVIHLDPWWNPAVEDQATDRAHRIGQTRPVTAYRLVARDTVEEKMLELQGRKRLLADAAINEGRLVGGQLTREDLEAVFS